MENWNEEKARFYLKNQKKITEILKIDLAQ